MTVNLPDGAPPANSGPRARETLTVACVYRTGSRLYSRRYVATLRDMVGRNLNLPHRFVCLSDDPEVPCERIALVTDWPTYFAKIELYRPGLFAGPVLYFDLDTVIHGNIDELARKAAQVTYGCVSDPRGGHMNTSVQAFTMDCSFIFERFRHTGIFDRRLRPHLWYTLRRIGLERLLSVGSSYGDQGFAEMCLTEAGVPVTHFDRELPGMFSTFNYTAAGETEPSGSICLMMRRPKPHEVTHGWVERHWRISSEAAPPKTDRVFPSTGG